MNEELEESETQSKKPINLDESDSIKVLLTVPKDLYKKLGHIAVERETSKAELIREGIKKQIEDYNKPEEQEIIIPDRKLDKLLKECSPDEDSFEIEGEDGFISKFKTKGWRLSDLTPTQWERVKEKIQIGYAGYFFKPEPEEFAEKFEVLEPSEEQYEWLSTETGEEEED